MTSFSTRPRRPGGAQATGVDGEQQGRHWALFADWCAATGRSSLPAEPATVVAFLVELPAGAATVARRVRAIDAAHRSAGLLAPGESVELDKALGRRLAPPRFDTGRVARALAAIPVGGWPTGIVGRRDAAIVALICSAGLTRAQVQALRTGTSDGLPLGSGVGSQDGRAGGPASGQRHTPVDVLEAIATAEEAGSCPACAMARWLHVAAGLQRFGWRTVRAELADLGEIPAGTEAAHACSEPFAWPTGRDAERSPLFCAIDRHGAPEMGYPLSTRSITAIVAGRLSAGERTPPGELGGADVGESSETVGVDGRPRWGVEDRHRVAARFAEVEAVLDEMEDEAEAILARVRAAMGDDLGSGSGRGRGDGGG